MSRTPGATAAWRRTYLPLPWMDDAICRGVDIELFFPESGKGSTARKAKAVCFQCPVIADCAQWAIADPSLAGVLGGFTERERRAIRADRRNR